MNGVAGRYSAVGYTMIKKIKKVSKGAKIRNRYKPHLMWLILKQTTLAPKLFCDIAISLTRYLPALLYLHSIQELASDTHDFS